VNFNTSDLIQLGMLAVAVAGLLVAGVTSTYRAIARRRGLSLIVEQFSKGPFYVARIDSASKPDAARVGTVATWLRVRIVNGTSTPILISELRAHEKGTSGSNPICSPVRRADLHKTPADVSELVELPRQIPGHDALEFFMLVAVHIPAELGRLLFQLYCRHMNPAALERTMQELRAHVLDDARKRIKYAQIVDVNIHEVGVSDPIMLNKDGRLLIEPRFGVIPLSAKSDVISSCVEEGRAVPELRISGTYIFEVVLSTGRRLRKTFATRQNALWFVGGMSRAR